MRQDQPSGVARLPYTVCRCRLRTQAGFHRGGWEAKEFSRKRSGKACPLASWHRMLFSFLVWPNVSSAVVHWTSHSCPVRTRGLQRERSASGNPKSTLLENCRRVLMKPNKQRMACRLPTGTRPTATRMFLSYSVTGYDDTTKCAQPRLTATSQSECANGVQSPPLFLCRPIPTAQ